MEIKVKFAFDPDKAESLIDLVRSPVAMALWTLWKRNHIVSDSFIDQCLAAAHNLRIVQPINVAQFSLCFPPYDNDFLQSDVKKFAPLFLSVLNSEATVVMVVNGEDRPIKIG